jgi:hypothetical protein
VAIIDRGRLQRIVDFRATSAEGALVPYRLMVASGADIVPLVFGDAVPAGPNEFDLPARPLDLLNRQLGDLMARGVLVASVAPVHTALEQQFREAISQ